MNNTRVISVKIPPSGFNITSEAAATQPITFAKAIMLASGIQLTEQEITRKEIEA